MSDRERFRSSIENPIRELRESLRLSQAQLAKRAKITPQVVLLNEIGVYGSINPSILSELATLSGESEHALSDEYDQWRINAARFALGRTRSLREVVGESWPHTPGMFHFEDVRAWARFKAQFASSTVGFCKVVKLQPSLVTSFEASNFRNYSVSITDWLEANSGVAHVD